MSGHAGRQKALSINMVSKTTGVPAHTIRFWEKDFGAYLNPSRTPGGQRRYSTSDVEVIEKIKHFRYEEDFTIEGTLKEIRRGLLIGEEIEKIAGEIARLITRRVALRVRRLG